MDKLEPAKRRLSLLRSPEMADEDESLLASEINSLECDIEKWDFELSEICKSKDQMIRHGDVTATLRRLGKSMSKAEISEMIWEADEKLDGVIDWDEFTLNFQRNIHDRSGLEPASFYNLVQFLIYDQNNNGFVSIDETMKMLYARYGRESMEQKIGILFGTAAKQEEGKEGGEIDFESYCEAVERTQMKMFKESELGRSIEAKKQRKQDPNRKKK
jgi:Ca2+-binding EF-hand superfamily protein